MKVLFLCKHNRFRSKVAEAFFLAFNKNSEIKVKSRGIVKDIDAHENVVRVLREYNLKLKDRKSRLLEKKDIEWADLIVIVADNVDENFLSGFKGKIIKWKIRDTSAGDIIGIKEIIGEVKEKVEDLVFELNKKV